MRVIVVAGTHSGVGKTSLATGLMQALRLRGFVVQAFKVGPDFLDPMHHSAATGRPSINLDGWMLNKEQVLESFHRHTADADVAVVEGVMGLFDGRDGSSEEGSTAQIAKWLGAPVVLVIDCWAMARSVAAVAKGYAEFDTELQVKGLLLNKVGSEAHGQWLREAVQACQQQQQQHDCQNRQGMLGVQVLGCIPKDPNVVVAERHLGLTMPHEQQQQQQPGQQQQQVPQYIQLLGQLIAQHVDLELLLSLAEQASPAEQIQQQQQQQQQQEEEEQLAAAPAADADGVSMFGGIAPLVTSDVMQHKNRSSRCRIAVPLDEAFCFYYSDNLTMLKQAGADVVTFSPLHDRTLPAGVSGIYLGGGYPERHAEQLSNNVTMLQQLQTFAAAGGVVYAECGGLIYLSQGFVSSSSSSSSTAGGGGKSSSSSTAGGGGKSSSSVAGGGVNTNSSNSRFVPLAGVLPFRTRMAGMKMGYVEVEVLAGNPIFLAGTTVRGQLYHFSEAVGVETTVAAAAAPAAAGDRHGSSADANDGSSNNRGNLTTPLTAAAAAATVGHVSFAEKDSSSSSGTTSSSSSMCCTYKLLPVRSNAVAQLEGYSVRNVLASYVHLHWGGCKQLAAAYVNKCSGSGVVTNENGGVTITAAAAVAAAGTPASAAAAAAVKSGKQSGSTGSSSKCCSVGSKDVIPASSSGCALSRMCCSSSSSRSDKILSLLPSGTEIVYALGLGHRLVGVSGFCDYPAEAQQQPKAVRPLLDVDSMTSHEIEIAMQGFKAAGVSPFEIDVQLLADLQPGLLLTQDACGTCDADCTLVCKALQQAGLNPSTTQVLVLHPKTLAEVLESIIEIGAAAGAAEAAHKLVTRLQQRLQGVAARVAAACPAAAAVLLTCTALMYKSSSSSSNLDGVGSTTAAGGRGQQAGSVDINLVGINANNSDGNSYKNNNRNNSSSSSSTDMARHPKTDVPQGDFSSCKMQQPEQRKQQQQMNIIGAGFSNHVTKPLRVLSLEGLNPLVLGGQWLPDVKAAAGAVDASGQQPGDSARRISWEQVLDYKPDVLLLSPCSRSTTAAMPDVLHLMQQPGFWSLPAVKMQRVYVVDHCFYSRPGPRLWEGIELLAALLYGVRLTDSSSTKCSGSCGVGSCSIDIGGVEAQCSTQECLLPSVTERTVLKLTVDAQGGSSWCLAA